MRQPREHHGKTMRKLKGSNDKIIWNQSEHHAKSNEKSNEITMWKQWHNPEKTISFCFPQDWRLKHMVHLCRPMIFCGAYWFSHFLLGFPSFLGVLSKAFLGGAGRPGAGTYVYIFFVVVFLFSHISTLYSTVFNSSPGCLCNYCAIVRLISNGLIILKLTYCILG